MPAAIGIVYPVCHDLEAIFRQQPAIFLRRQAGVIEGLAREGAQRLAMFRAGGEYQRRALSRMGAKDREHPTLVVECQMEEAVPGNQPIEAPAERQVSHIGHPPVLIRHALPNAAAPIIAVVALNLAYLIVGVVVIEVVFVYPGVGQYMVDGVSKRDLPVVQACGLVFAGTFIILNTIADILSILVNPRLRKPSMGK